MPHSAGPAHRSQPPSIRIASAVELGISDDACSDALKNNNLALVKTADQSRDTGSIAAPFRGRPDAVAMSERSLHLSNNFVISCGTVSVDVQKQLLLAILYRRTGEYLLPKGRKDIGERLEETATRETSEETGYRVTLLQHAIPTLATQPKDKSAYKHSNEPVAVTQRTTKEQVLKIIFWFAAEVDSTEIKVEDTQDENEDLDTVWIPFGKVNRLSFEDDQSIATEVISSVSDRQDC